MTKYSDELFIYVIFSLYIKYKTIFCFKLLGCEHGHKYKCMNCECPMLSCIKCLSLPIILCILYKTIDSSCKIHFWSSLQLSPFLSWQTTHHFYHWQLLRREVSLLRDQPEIRKILSHDDESMDAWCSWPTIFSLTKD